MTDADFPGRRLRVAVLMGGTSAERDVSLSTGRQILDALDPEKYAVAAIDTRDIVALPGHGSAPFLAAVERSLEPGATGVDVYGQEEPEPALVPAERPNPPVHVSGERPDVVFIALHGKGGEDGSIQGTLELLGLPYTGSGVLPSALAMNKAMSKRLFRAEGIPTVPEIQARRGACRSEAELFRQVEEQLGGFPVFVKPNAEGSTFGCTLVKTPDQLSDAIALALRYDETALIETYVRGMEITVGVLETLDDPPGLQALPVIEIVPQGEFYDYESKYAEGGSEHIIPARLPDAQRRRAQEIALRCHQVLGCRGMSRTDLIVEAGRMFVLEVNTIPGMTPTSLLPQAAEHAGIAFSALLDRLIACALNREEPTR